MSKAFGGEVAAFYEEYMVPLVFEPYAADLVERLSQRPMGDVLETAAGTGIVTRKLAALRVNTPNTIVATDLSQAMLDLGRTACPESVVTWRQADATALPFPDASFDLVVCQFGAMFFRDGPEAYQEARRMLRPGGRFIFSVWDRLQLNEFAETVTEAVAKLFPDNPPTFLSRVPHGYFDTEVISRDLSNAGFEQPPVFEAVTKLSRAASASIPAQAFVRGTPMRGEIEARDPAMLEAAVNAAESALANRFGRGTIEGRMQAFVVTVQR